MILARTLRQILAFVLMALFVTPQPGQAFASSSGDFGVSSSESAAFEVEVEYEIERQVDALLRDPKFQSRALPNSVLAKIKREVMLKVREFKLVSGFVKRHGRAAGVAYIAIQVISTFIVPPLMIYLNQSLAATASATLPWAIGASLLTVAVQTQKLRKQVAKNLGLRSLLDLDRVRSEVLGYNAQHRISSAIFSSLKRLEANDVEFEILKRNPVAANAPFATVQELESIARVSPKGAGYLQQIYLEKSQPELYAALILTFISHETEAGEALLALLKTRELQVQSSPDLRNRLVAIANLRKQITRDLVAIQGELRALKSSTLSGAVKEKSKADLIAESERLLKVRFDLMHFEYSILLSGDDDTSAFSALRTESRLSVSSLILRTTPQALSRGVFGMSCRARFAP